MKEFLLSMPALLVGFLLGVLSPIATDLIGRAPKRRRALRGIAVEANELRTTLAFATQQVLSALGILKPAHVAKLRPILLSHLTRNSDDPGAPETVRLLEQGDDAYASMWNARATPDRGPSPVPYRMPFLELSLSDLGLFSKATQARILQLHHHVQLFNEKVDLVKELSRRTFDASIEGANRKALEDNLISSQVNLAERAFAAIDAISRLVDANGDPLTDAR